MWRRLSGITVMTIMAIVTIVVTLLVGIVPRHTSAVEELESMKKEIQQKLDELCNTVGFPGATLGIVLPDGHSISFASGYADLEKKVHMETHHRIFSGSIGKTYVAAVALQLIKENKISLEDKLSTFFSHKKWFKRLPNSNEIKLLNLMNHTGGLPMYEGKEELWKRLQREPDKVWSGEDRLAYILDDKPVHPVGKGWYYSDTDYILVGMIIEKVTGRTYYQELKQRILDPRGLKNTTPSDKRKLKDLVPGYTGHRKPPFWLPGKTVKDGQYAMNPQMEWTGGGLITTAEELAQFIKMLMEGKVLEPDSLELMKRPVNEETGKPDETGYGLGLEVWKTAEGIAYGHRGIVPGYLSITQYVPRYKFSIALQINADKYSGKLDKSKSRLDYIDAIKPVIVKFLSNQSNRVSK
jgi:D-alanyl-D-alanine carboxypeptidase